MKQFLPAVIQWSGKARIIVADNASNDKSLQILQENFPTVECIKLTENFGFCGGYNRALKQIEAEYYVLLNSDVEVTENWLQPLYQLLESNQTIAAVQPKIKSYHHKNEFEYAGAAGGFIDTLGYPFCRGRIFDAIEPDNNQYNDTTEIFWATGACMMVRSSIYHRLSGLDEDFFAHMEEIDLCWRMKNSGYSVYYCGQSTVYHVGGGTLNKLSSKKTYLNFRNGLFLLIKNLPISELIWKMPFRLLLDYLAAFKFLLSRETSHAGAIIKAHLHCVFMCRKMWQKRRPNELQSNLIGQLPRLIVWDYFIRGIKQFKA